MASVRVDRMDARQGRLPPVCICCGHPTEQLVEHRFYYQPTWLVICNLILPAIVRWCLAYNSVVIPVPICPRHAWRLQLPTLMGYGLAGVLLLIVPVLLLLSFAEHYNALLAVGLVALLLVLVMLPAILVAQLLTPRAYDISDLFLGLTAVSDQFAGAARRGGRGLLAAPAPLESCGGLPQPQPAYAPAAGSYAGGPSSAGARPWIVALVITGCVLAVAVLAGAGIVTVAIRMKSRPKSDPIAALPPGNEGSSFSTPMPSPSASFASPSTSSAAPPTSFTPPNFGSPPEPKMSERARAAAAAAASIPSKASSTTDPTAAGESSNASPGNASTAPAAGVSATNSRPSSSRPGPNRRSRPPSGGSSAPPEGERPEPPIHALDLRTRKVVFPPDHVAIPATFVLPPGQAVWARQHEGPFWHAAFVAAVDGDQVTVRYKGWSDFFNETMSRDMLCIDKSLLSESGSRASNSAAATGSGGKMRIWTDVTGKYKVEAALVKAESGQVTLQKANGDRTTLPIEKLSEADQEFLKQEQ